MLTTSDMLRLLRKSDHSIDDIKLCYNTAIYLGYKGQNLVDTIETMLNLIKRDEHQSSFRNKKISHVKHMRDKFFVRKTLLEMQKVNSLFS